MTRDFFTFNITENVLYDAIQRPDKFQWKLDYHFNGTRYKDMAGGYGRTISCATLYALLGDPFLERYFETVYPYIYLKEDGDMFIYEAGQEIFPYVEEVGFSRNEAEDIRHNLATNEVRFERAEERLENAKEKLDSLYSDMEYLEENAVRTKSENIDKRYRTYRRILSLTEELNSIQSQIDSLESSYNRERTRVMNSRERYNKSIKHAKEMLSTAKETFSNRVREKGIGFAEDVRQDIINRLASGSLPLNTHNVHPRTQKLRMEAGLPPFPRFYASGQFISGVVVDIKLEKR